MFSKYGFWRPIVEQTGRWRPFWGAAICRKGLPEFAAPTASTRCSCGSLRPLNKFKQKRWWTAKPVVA